MATEAPHAPYQVGRVGAMLPPYLFAAALGFLTAAMMMAPFLVGELGSYFYETRLLALTHTITLGWISMVMCGVLYRYVPALTKRHVPYPRVAIVQALTLAGGALVIVVGFWMGAWPIVTAAAAILLVSAVLLGVNMCPLLLAAPQQGVAERGGVLAVGFFVLAALLGTVLAIDKTYPLVGGSLLTNLGAHVQLAALGWVSLMICSLSFRLLPAFLLPAVQLPEAARRLVLALAAAIILLVGALLAQSALAVPLAFVTAGALLGYLGLIGRVVASHRQPFDFTARHAIAGGVWLLVATASGCALAVVGAETEIGARLAATYGVAGLLGWMTNLIFGISYKLFPGFVSGCRLEAGRAPVAPGIMAVPEIVRPAIFLLYNGGLLAAVSGLMAADLPIAIVGALTLGAGGVLYVGGTARTLAFAFVDPPPDAVGTVRSQP